MGITSPRWSASTPAKTKGVDKSEMIAASEEKQFGSKQGEDYA